MAARAEESNGVIVIDRLRKRFGRIEALKGVSLTVRRGEIFSLLGPNGAGKTTLIKLIVGSLRPDAGSVTLMGMDPIQESPLVRRRLGYMPQAPALYEDLSPRENVRFLAQPHALAELERRIDETLEFIGLRSREHDPVFTFSGGMKQRVSLACALVHRPELLLLDEPTAGVDPKLRQVFWQHFRTLASGGATLLMSTHQMDEVLHCDRVAVMREGMVLACETPNVLLQRGQTTIRVRRGEQVESATVANYAEELPRLLQRYELDPDVSRIEIEQDTLETIVLRLINAADSTGPSPKEPAHAERT
jgi:ABC-2 type transport system ATP-binding protein